MHTSQISPTNHKETCDANLSQIRRKSAAKSAVLRQEQNLQIVIIKQLQKLSSSGEILSQTKITKITKTTKITQPSHIFYKTERTTPEASDANNRGHQPPEIIATAKTTVTTTRTRTHFKMTWDLRLQPALIPGTNNFGPGIWKTTWDLRPRMTWDQHIRDNQTTGPEDIEDVSEVTEPEDKKRQEEP
jgi:hypothetical protein